MLMSQFGLAICLFVLALYFHLGDLNLNDGIRYSYVHIHIHNHDIFYQMASSVHTGSLLYLFQHRSIKLCLGYHSRDSSIRCQISNYSSGRISKFFLMVSSYLLFSYSIFHIWWHVHFFVLWQHFSFLCYSVLPLFA